MARPVWSGALTFGLVSLPVGLYSATDSHTIRFHQLQRGTSDRVRNRRVNERTGEEVPLDDVVKGFDAGDEYVVLEPEELDDIAPGRSRALDVSGFVDLADIDPVYFDRTYYLGPGGEGYAKVYALLVRALARAGKAAVATFVMRSREYLVAVQAEGDVLTLHTLHWADEVRDPKRVMDVPSRRTQVSDRELRTAEQLIESLTTDWDPGGFRDTYQERVARLVEAKQKGETVEKAESPADPTNVVNLMDALRASVDRAKDTGRGGGRGSARRGGGGSGGRGTGGRTAGAGGGRERGKAAGKGASSRARLADLTKDQLYRRASDAGVHGRSGMNREELIRALSSNDGRRAAS
ncbi:non-homologous end joining protein Ku [Streptomyces sulfonofaciens]|uniref:Non-homologous end joining protein Ku n=1 Tax=Streptomyces sulfonofaciens TaxID=68272 RepID=A0A919G922_9ACTN|nr:Ku protein [Streptomyces sulfonofaciens]GHH79668.1 non-homologous end joining protein Ku [Streptomyces sulfonofaciens]